MAAKSQKTEANATSRHFETADAEPTGAACLPAAEPIDAALTQLDYYYGRDAGSGNKDEAPDGARPGRAPIIRSMPKPVAGAGSPASAPERRPRTKVPASPRARSSARARAGR